MTLLLVWLASATGITDWISTVLPFGLGQIALDNTWLGMLLLIIGCSALWAFEVQRLEFCGADLIFGTIWLTTVVVIFQFCFGFIILGWAALLGPFD